MLVSNYVEQFIQSRPYKYSSKQTLIRDIKKLQLWDKDTDEVNSGYVRDIVEIISNHNSRRRLYITARAVFKDLGKCQDLPVLETVPREYEFPTQTELEWMINKSKYRLQLLLCMYAGLRVGEACAITPAKIQGNYLIIDQAWSQDGMHLGSPKTYGKVLIPDWLIEEVQQMKESDIWKKGMTTKLVSGSTYKISHMKSSRELTGNKFLNPHLLRHWFATDMIRRGVNPEIVRRQMRHKKIETTMKVYVQVNNKEIESAIPMRPEERIVADLDSRSNVISINSKSRKC
jgi:integrase